MTAEVLQLNPHERMSVKDALEYAARNYDQYSDVIIVGIDHDGALTMNSSHMDRHFATYSLLEAVDKARGKS